MDGEIFSDLPHTLLVCKNEGDFSPTPPLEFGRQWVLPTCSLFTKQKFTSMKIAQEFALPVREAGDGKIDPKGTLVSLIEDTDEVIIGAKGVTVIGKNGQNFFAGYSKGVLAGIKAGTFTSSNLGNLIVYTSTYKDGDGKEQHRLKLGVPQGVFSTRTSASELKEAAATSGAFTPQKVSLSEIKMTELVG